MANQDETKSLSEMNPVHNTGTTKKKPQSFADRNLQAALDRAAAKEAEQQAEMEKLEAERKQDGRRPEFEYEVEGFNIGESLERRMEFASAKAEAYKEAKEAAELEAEINSEEAEEEPVEESSEPVDVEEDDDFSLDDPSEDEYKDDIESEIDNDIKKEEDKEVQEAKKVVESVSVPKTAEEDISSVPLRNRELPSQSDFDLGEDDFSDIDLDDEPTSSVDDQNKISDEDMEELKKQINEKLYNHIPDAGNIIIADDNDTITVSQMLAQDNTSKKVFDWPLMCAGKCVSMQAWSGPEIDELNLTTTGRNRFNAMKDIYRNIYNHIVSAKPKFEDWLKTTSFLDLDHIYIAIYKASFNGANYIPINCDNNHCNKVFLTDDIDIKEKMTKFKDKKAKERFEKIYAGEPVEKYNDKIFKPISPTIAIQLREPSIYNTIFENSVLDQKFIDKYERLLTMMVYIENIYLIGPDGKARKLKYKIDKTSIARTCKYRIATFAKIIKSLPSDSYNTLVAEISKLSEKDGDVTYQFPEVDCPYCGNKIDATDATAQQLLFTRHRLSLLSTQ